MSSRPTGDTKGRSQAFQAGIDGAPPLRIVTGGDQAAWLVDHQIDLAFANRPLAVDRNVVAIRVDAQRGIADDRAADRDPALGDQHLSLRARAYAEFRQGAVEADARAGAAAAVALSSPGRHLPVRHAGRIARYRPGRPVLPVRRFCRPVSRESS